MDLPLLPNRTKVRGRTVNALVDRLNDAKLGAPPSHALTTIYDGVPVRRNTTPNLWKMSGLIVSGDARIYIRPGLVNSSIPTISGTSLAAVTQPFLVVTGSAGIVYLKLTHDSAGTITDLIVESAASVPADTTTGTLTKHRSLGPWTSSGGVFTSVVSLLNTNQTFRLCAGAAEWY